MYTKRFILITVVILQVTFVLNCLITNCPRGGKRNGKINLEASIKPCVSCGPGKSGQCFGPRICCGPFGCLFGTTETAICKREGFFHDAEPCIAGNTFCRRNTGRCATEGVCCNQESCHVDRLCTSEEKNKGFPIDFYNFINYANPAEYNTD